MTPIELNNEIIKIQYEKLLYGGMGIVKNNINESILLNMCYNIINNNNIFDTDVSDKINNIIELIYDNCK